MSLESDFYATLNVAGVTSLVGDRISPSHDDNPDGATAPFVIYLPISAIENYDLDGGTGVTRCRMQVDCYDDNPDGAAALARAVITAVPQTGWPIHRTAHTNQDLGLEPGTRLFRRLVEFSLFHRSS